MIPSDSPIYSGRVQPALGFDFVQSPGLVAGRGGQTITFTRATSAWYFNSAGNLVDAGSGNPRFDYNPVTLDARGLLMEEARTNLLLWNRDLTNVAWTPTSITPLKNITGLDGSANSASRITATGASGTLLQIVTSASATRISTAYVKRLTGTGTIEMTQNGGTLWTDITSSINASTWTRVGVPSATVTNPSVGFRITTSTDAIAVDGVQLESNDCSTSVILTTTVAFTRNTDSALINTITPWYNQSEGTIVWVGDVSATTTDATTRAMIAIGDPALAFGSAEAHYIARSAGSANITLNILDGGVSQVGSIGGAATVDTVFKVAACYKLNDCAVSMNGAAAVTDVVATMPTPTACSLGNTTNAWTGGSNPLNGHIRSLAYYPRSLKNQLPQLST